MRGEANLGPHTADFDCLSPACQAVARENRKRRVMSIVADALPTPQGRIFDLVRLLAEPVKNLTAVNEIVRAEPLLNAQVVGLVNSSSQAGSCQTPTFSEAVVLVGAERLQILAAGCAVAEFAGRRLPIETMRDFWYHSLLTALVSEKIAREAHPESSERAYLAGLLHDVGRLPFLIASQDEETSTGNTLHHVHDEPASERNHFGVDHCEVGRWMAFSGKFSPWMTDVIEHHHEPSQATEDPHLVAIVAAADRSNAASSQFDTGHHSEWPAGKHAYGRILSSRPQGLLQESQALQSQFLESSPLDSLFPAFGNS
jgi:putative nucleotidyltransferase with HDIG domain